MSNNSSSGDTTDLRGYAIRILNGNVFYFNSNGVMDCCPIEDGFIMQLKDLYRKSITSPAMLKRSYSISGYNNKNAFKSAATQMRVGKTISDFCQIALVECERQSTKPFKTIWNPESQKFLLDTHLPSVTYKKDYIRITVRFKINPKKRDGYTSVARAMQEISYFADKAKSQLSLVEECKDIPFAKLPDPSRVSIDPENVVFEFRI